LLSHELDVRLAEVDVAAQDVIEGGQPAAGWRAFIAVVPDNLAHHTPVLPLPAARQVLDVSLVVLLVLAGAGEGNVFLSAVAR